jgi:hypothetical protein
LTIITQPSIAGAGAELGNINVSLVDDKEPFNTDESNKSNIIETNLIQINVIQTNKKRSNDMEANSIQANELSGRQMLFSSSELRCMLLSILSASISKL